MKKILYTFTILMVLLLVFSSMAYAGPLGKIKSWITGEVIAFGLSAIATVIAGATGLMYRKVTRTLTEAGEFMTAVGTALSDGRINKDEIATILKEGKDVFDVWRKTPVRFRVQRE